MKFQILDSGFWILDSGIQFRILVSGFHVLGLPDNNNQLVSQKSLLLLNFVRFAVMFL